MQWHSNIRCETKCSVYSLHNFDGSFGFFFGTSSNMYACHKINVDCYIFLFCSISLNLISVSRHIFFQCFFAGWAYKCIHNIDWTSWHISKYTLIASPTFVAYSCAFVCTCVCVCHSICDLQAFLLICLFFIYCSSIYFHSVLLPFSLPQPKFDSICSIQNVIDIASLFFVDSILTMFVLRVCFVCLLT